jgi:hypothetical protein
MFKVDGTILFHIPSLLLMVFSGVVQCGLVDGTNVLDEPGASILYPENGGISFLRNVGAYVQDYTTPHVR